MWNPLSDARVRYVVVGAWNTLFGVGLYNLLFLVPAARAHYVALAAVVHAASVTNAFVGHRWFTFRSNGPLLGEFVRFNVTYLGALGVTVAGIPLLVRWLRLDPRVAQATLTFLVIALTYAVHRVFTFRT